jgi:hypothetical protein
MTLPEARRRECPSDHKASRRHGTVLPRASGSCVPLVFVDSSRTGERAAGLLGRPADDRQPGRGGSGIGAIPDRLEGDLELIRRSRQFGALGDDEAAAVVAEPPPCLALDTPGWPRWIKVEAEERKISLSLLPVFQGILSRRKPKRKKRKTRPRPLPDRSPRYR